MRYIIVFFVFLSTMAIQAQQNSTFQPTVVVNGEGNVKVKPDQVLINSRIEHEGDNAAEVKKMNDEVVDRVIKYLRSEGIPEKNIRTAYLNLSKNYNYNDKTYNYSANQAISIKLDDLKNYEKVISGLFDVGLNRIDGIQFLSSQMEKHTSEARRKAVLNAKLKAEEYVAPLNQSIGKAVYITEQGSDNYQPLYRMEMMKSSADGTSQETIAPGEMEVSVKVTIGFFLN